MFQLLLFAFLFLVAFKLFGLVGVLICILLIGFFSLKF